MYEKIRNKFIIKTFVSCIYILYLIKYLQGTTTWVQLKKFTDMVLATALFYIMVLKQHNRIMYALKKTIVVETLGNLFLLHYN